MLFLSGLLSAGVWLMNAGAAGAWPPRAYVAVVPAPGYTYVQYARPAYVVYPPQGVTYAQPAAVQLPLAAPNDDTAAALARVQAELRQLTYEANVRALQTRVLELERRSTTPAPPK
jgi:hypothetical protein